jgi:hypothetical protein
MFSISSTEFPDFSAFVEKVSSLNSTSTTSESGDITTAGDSETHNLRTWCSERGFLFHFSKTPSGVFYTLKYDRAKLTEEQYDSLGRFRSVVFDSNGKVCCIAPPKMLKISDSMKSCPVNSAGGHLSAEELVEGIMVNLFWHGGKWYIATKSCVGEVSFDHIVEAQAEAQVQADIHATDAPTEEGTRTTFQRLSVQEVLRRRICDVLSLLPGGLDTVPKEYCYSLVVQHPKNQIVNVISVPKLYLVAAYQLSPASEPVVGINAIRIDRDIFSANFGGSVSHMPSGLTCVADAETDDAATATFTPHSVDDYCTMYASPQTASSVSLPGVVFVDKDTGFCYKMRNAKYESVKKRKGMEQKLMAQYLQLRKDHGIDEYLKYHPQHSRAFRQFRDRLHEYTQRLYDAYIEHYVKKDAKPLKDYDRELKTHMYKLHYDVYLATMKESAAFVTKHTVINYVNQLAAAQQLACLNASAGSGTSTSGTHTASGSASASTTADGADVKRKPFQRRPIERSKPAGYGHGYGGQGPSGGDAETKSGFRSARPARGGRMVPSLTVQIPRVDENGDDDRYKSSQIKGAKSTGSVKVHNQFAGLNVD